MAMNKKIPLVEVFGPTIQGEGMMIGKQTYFLRFGLCDMKCKMCDSMHAVDPKQVKENAEWLTEEEIAEKFLGHIQTNTTNWVTFSGGNPCIHELGKLVELLKTNNFRIAVETQGTFCPDWLQHVDCLTVSPKGPGMGEKLDIDRLDLFMKKVSQWDQDFCMKVVAFDQRDLEIAAMLYERYEGSNLCDDQFYLSLGNTVPPHSPFADEITRAELIHLMLKNYKFLFEEIKAHPILSQFTFLPQWHAFLWGNEKGR